jgi:hypothetical protein
MKRIATVKKTMEPQETIDEEEEEEEEEEGEKKPMNT